MSTLHRLFCMMPLVFSLSACRLTSAGNEKDGHELASAPSSADEVLLIYMGGFNSCAQGTPRGLGGMAKFEETKARIEGTGKKVHYVLSCYHGMSSTQIHWLSSSEPDSVYGVDWNDPAEQGQLFDEVIELSANFTRPIFVIGHSYGGWLTSNLVAHLRELVGSEKVELVTALFTIDPISPYHCNQIFYALTLGKYILNLGDAFPKTGCESAPPQYLAADTTKYPAAIINGADGTVISKVMGGTRRWFNFYQDRDFLHSSSIAINLVDALQNAISKMLQPSKHDSWPRNFRVKYDNFPFSLSSSPHIRIHVNNDVWDAIQQQIYGSLGMVQSLYDDQPSRNETHEIDSTAQPTATPPAKQPTPEQLAALQALLASSQEARKGPLSEQDILAIQKIFDETKIWPVKP